MHNLTCKSFCSPLVEDAFFEGELEIPIINAPTEIVVSQSLIPFSKRNRSVDFTEFIHFYENDDVFEDVLRNPDAYIDDFRRFRGIISPDCSLYYPMPLSEQIANTVNNRALGYYFQKHGISVITNVRWGDERTYTTKALPERLAFLGAPHSSIVSVGTYGCCKEREEKAHLKAGLREMLKMLSPRIVLIYGAMPKKIFDEFRPLTTFVQFPDWISTKRRRVK